jgi:hypothetical protein
MEEKENIVQKKKKSNYYFTKDTEGYIIKFKNSSSDFEKNRIYEKHIHPAFTELVCNLVTVYNYKSFGEEMDHFKSDCVSFLFETIHKWDESKGTKAFSYFNVVAKNWLTIQSRRLYKNYKRNVDINNHESLTKEEKKFLFGDNIVEEDPADDREDFIVGIYKVIDVIEGKIKSERDKKCVAAIRHLYDNIDKVNFFNKRAVFVYMREISGLNNSELSSSLSRIRKIYREIQGEDKLINLEDYKK